MAGLDSAAQHGWTRAIRNARVATCTSADAACGLIESAAIVIAGDRIAWVGSDADVPRLPAAADVVDAGGALVTPGLIDCHTHLVFAGHRAREFELRQRGASYAEIAAAGGGIVSTVHQTREASEDQLLAIACERARTLLAEGVTTIEIKSGYGLDVDSELKLLRVARRVADHVPVTVHATLLAAHTVPPEFAGRADAYVDLIVDEILPTATAAGLVDSVDAFCETLAFTAAQVDRVFTRARSLGLPVRLHAEQLSNSNGAALAARHGALSADHLEHLDAAGVEAMAQAGTIAVLLPTPYYFLRDTQLPPLDLLRKHGVPLAVASDFNPGTSPLLSIRIAMNMACVLFGLTPAEALLGATRNAALALDRGTTRGVIAPAAMADLVVWNARDPSEIPTQVGAAAPRRVMRHGQWVAVNG